MSSVTAIRESLITIDNMLTDLVVEHEQSPEFTEHLKQLIETAQHHIAAARVLRPRQAINDEAQAKEDLVSLSMRLTVKEKWTIRLLSKRNNIDPDLLGNNSDRLIKFGLIHSGEGKVVLTEAGHAMNALWEKR
jgi:hypothetical protein